MGHDALTPERAEGLIVEGSGFIEAIAAEGYVGQDAGVLVGHQCGLLDGWRPSLARQIAVCRLAGQRYCF